MFDQANIEMTTWPGGTMLAPNTERSKKYGILVTNSTIFSNGAPNNSMYLGRPVGVPIEDQSMQSKSLIMRGTMPESTGTGPCPISKDCRQTRAL